MTPEEFVRRCPLLWHVAPTGAWSRIAVSGLQAAQQLIDAASVDQASRARLTNEPRRAQETLVIAGATVTLRDQGPLLARRDLTPLLSPGMTTADWIQLLNKRIYLFGHTQTRDTLTQKYVQRDGHQEVLTFDSACLLRAAGRRVQLAAQNTGAIKRTSEVYKDWDTFVPLARFPDERPKEITVVGGMTCDEVLSSLVQVERFHRSGAAELLAMGGQPEADH